MPPKLKRFSKGGGTGNDSAGRWKGQKGQPGKSGRGGGDFVNGDEDFIKIPFWGTIWRRKRNTGSKAGKREA